MGTNYYAVKKKPKSLYDYSIIHIGKSSCGWKFLFKYHDNEDLKLRNYNEYKNFILNKDYAFYDEYDKEIKGQELLDLIDEKQKNNNSNNFKYNKNIGGYRFSNEDFS